MTWSRSVRTFVELHDPLISGVEHNDRGLAIIVFTGSDRLNVLGQSDLIRVVSSRRKAIVAIATPSPLSAIMLVLPAPVTTRLVWVTGIGLITLLLTPRVVLTPTCHSSSESYPGLDLTADRQKEIRRGPRRSSRPKMATEHRG